MITTKDLVKTKIIPVVVLENVENALPLANSLESVGQNVIEVTLRTDAALKSIETISKSTNLIVGAGTVTNHKQVEQVKKLGAKFIVSPGFEKDIVKSAIDLEMPIFPGAVTPSEILKAINCGLNIVKFFPANIYGGLKGITALSGPFSTIKFIPTGGVNQDNLKEFLENKNILAVGGSWMVSPILIKERNFDKIKQLTDKALEIAKNIN